MSHSINDSYLETMKERFEEIVKNKEWWNVDPLYIELESNGFSHEVIALSNLMTGEEVQEYRRWDLKQNEELDDQIEIPDWFPLADNQ